MVKTCVVLNCNTAKAGEGVSLHRLPLDPNLRGLWLRALLNETGQQVFREDDLICSKHFAPDCYEMTDRGIVMRDDAIPFSHYVEVADADGAPNVKRTRLEEKKPLNDEELVTYIQEYPMLYNIESIRCSKSSERENAWEEIGRRLDCKGSECKIRWKHLRDSYRKYFNQMYKKGGDQFNLKRTYRLEKQMSFLNPIFEKQKGIDGGVIVQVDNSKQMGGVATTAVNGKQTKQMDSDIEDETQKIDSSLPDPLVEEVTIASPTSTPSLDTKRRTKPPPNLTAFSVLQEYINYKKTTEKKADHLTKYFASVEETVRSLPAHLQVKIKTEISNILHRAEYEAIVGTATGRVDGLASAIDTAKIFSTSVANGIPTFTVSAAYDNACQTSQDSSQVYSQPQTIYITPQTQDGIHNISYAQLTTAATESEVIATQGGEGAVEYHQNG